MKTTAPDIMSAIGLNFLPISDIHGILVDFLYRILWRNRTAKTGQDSQQRTASAGQTELIRQEGDIRKWDSPEKNTRTAQPEYDCQERSTRTGQPVKDSQNRL
jgi:hypothetical protein